MPRAHVLLTMSGPVWIGAQRETAMFDVIPYWMWAASLLVLALVCGAALNPQESRRPRALRTRHAGTLRPRWPMR
ncbi:hypothetical protein BWU74_15590 [Paraburkholderia caledonica]|nr:hypothetical protein BWU74_15590 [Burkholderia sp. Bk]